VICLGHTIVSTGFQFSLHGASRARWTHASKPRDSVGLRASGAGSGDDLLDQLSERQVLWTKDPKTGTNIALVGSMHYNPHSIQLVEGLVGELGEQGRLKSVVVESCDTRWNIEQDLRKEMDTKQLELYGALLHNEMRAASQVASKYDRPVVLGDQLINATDQRLRTYASATVKDLFNPGDGWKRIYEDLWRGIQSLGAPVTGTGSKRGLGFQDIADPRLLVHLPVSLIRYPAAIVVRYPVQGTALLTALTILSLPPDVMMPYLGEAIGSGVSAQAAPLPGTGTYDALLAASEPALSVAASLAFSVIESVFLARILLVPVLMERNVVLTESILEACSAAKTKGPGSQDTVVAVLGMAHCNDVKRLIEEPA